MVNGELIMVNETPPSPLSNTTLVAEPVPDSNPVLVSPVTGSEGGRVLSEKKNFAKAEVAFVFRAPYRIKRDDLEHLFEIEVPEEMQGAVDWETG